MKNTLLLLIFLTSLNSCAQKIKFKNFELISYEIESKNNIEFNSYSTIDKNGKLKVYINGSRGKAYYSYQLNDDEIKIVNRLYDQNLEDFVKKKRLDPNQGYAGSRNYISFQKNEHKNSLCYIVPFMNSEFTAISDLLTDKIYAQKDSAKIGEFNIDFKRLEKEIIKQNQIDNYLPQKQLPPPPMR
ncbi:hypothetical protein CMU93_14140 [Elizabethkingia anophelis]|uniref:hypothetical protein n=1 Tax=Elizabethkingia anophelis TaxID=1117645 RepID=UPI000998E8DE|nr:hypothetical protein [Elizabethkingia anophelis]MDV2448640.1 hypothetical protein [Elizabethkingia anophelis]OPC33115.1 hypothetical protein BAX98_04550 [Elizabethkingia anophelis]